VVHIVLSKKPMQPQEKRLMMLGRCDNCNQLRPGSRAAPHGCEGFFCYVCRGDILDPYGELSMEPYRLPGERLTVWAFGESIYIHTNGRALALERLQAAALAEGITKVLSGEYDRASTDDQAAPSEKSKARETTRSLLEDLDL
jgi:hypothetical protein